MELSFLRAMDLSTGPPIWPLAEKKSSLLPVPTMTNPFLIKLGDHYVTYSPTILELKKLRQTSPEQGGHGRDPCQIHTVRKMQVLRVIPSDVIQYYFGLFCMENFS
jgi:coenzyme F420-reducing hydrogenase beta subunit